MNILEVDSLTCEYKKNIVLDKISFNIKKGELWCFLGPNGVGKTTLFKTILGINKCNKGNIVIKGRKMNLWTKKELSKVISYVPQHTNIAFPYLVREIIEMGRNPYQSFLKKVKNIDLEHIENIIDMLKIKHLKNKLYTQISGGEKQLVLIARALVQDTEIMVLDEPVANLDFGNEVRIMKQILRLTEELKKTVILTTHSPDHGFYKNANVLMLKDKRIYRIGKGMKEIDERAIKYLYDIDIRIIDIEDLKKRACLPL